MTELMRANKVAVKITENGYVATFKRTHKLVANIHSENTDWNPPAGLTKSGEREDFRKWAIDNASVYNVKYQPENLQPDSQVRIAHYETDEQLIKDVIAANANDYNKMVQETDLGGKLEWCGMSVDDIAPKTHTGKGVELSHLGIKDGKYGNGNWAWADINCALTMKYDGNEFYLPLVIELVSGQLRKTKFNKTKFMEAVVDEIVEAGLATKDKLIPPKEEKKSKKKSNKSNTKKESDKSDTKKDMLDGMKKAELIKMAIEMGLIVESSTNKKFKVPELKEMIRTGNSNI